MDLKADNLLFVTDRESLADNEVLKIIDFGGSEFIDSETRATASDASRVANVCKMRQAVWSDDRYSSPEQNHKCDDPRKKAKKLSSHNQEGEAEEERFYPVGWEFGRGGRVGRSELMLK